jgi:hypothetical protein
MIPAGTCEFCGQDAAVGDAVIFGPPVESDEQLRTSRGGSSGGSPCRSVFLHRECDALINGGSQ